MAKTKIQKFKSLRDASTRADAGDEVAQRCIIGFISNTGCDHLMTSHRKMYGDKERTKWQAAWMGLNEYISALVGEYGVPEVKAEKEVLAELNNAFSYQDTISLNW
jgi:hypothetical protein